MLYSVTLFVCTHNRWHIEADSEEEAIELAKDGFGVQVESYDCPNEEQPPLVEVVGVDVDIEA